MRLFFYYAVHSVKNQIKKLLKTWVLILLVVCVALGALIGVGISLLEDTVSSDEEGYVEDAGDDIYEEIPYDEEALVVIDAVTSRARGVAELVAGALILAVMVFSVLGADKNGSKIFLPADVNLLFAAPLRPQSVLLFRLMTQLGMILFASVYVLMQLPNLMNNLGMGLWAGLALVLAWCLTIAISKLLQVLLYTVSSTHPGLKKHLRRAVYGVLLLIAAAYVAFWQQSGLGYLDAALALYASPASRAIPVWGWLKGIVMFAVEGALGKTLLCIGGCLLGGVILLVFTWRVKADFYEDAMARSEEMAELLEQAYRAQQKGGIAIIRRKKDRSDRLRRDGLRHGCGANVFFFKSLYNRFRFAHLGFFTKTAETYLAASVLMSLLCVLVFESHSMIPVSLLLAVFVFYRTLGDPLGEDTKMDFFRMIPENMWAKLFYSMAAGAVNCLLDVLPAMLAALALLQGSVASALGWIVFIVSVDLYGTATGTFISLSVPVSAGKTVKQVVQVLFLYFGLLPDAVIVAAGLILGFPAAALVGAAAVNMVLSGVFFLLSPLFLEPGQR